MRIGRIVSRVSVIFTLLLGVLYFSPIVPATARWLTGRWEQPKGDILIVLGADQLGDGTPGIVSWWRSVYAARAWRSGGFKRIVISGGPLGYPGGVSIARAMSDSVVALGVPREAITLEEHSKSTRENALFTARMIAGWPGTKVLLTSDTHMRRAHAAFRKAGLETIPAPIPDVGKRWNDLVQRWDCIWAVGTQAVQYFYYEARGWL